MHFGLSSLGPQFVNMYSLNCTPTKGTIWYNNITILVSAVHTKGTTTWHNNRGIYNLVYHVTIYFRLSTQSTN